MTFQKKHTPWNKGIKVRTNTGKTLFKKGHKTLVGKHWKVKDTSKMGKSRIGVKRPPRSPDWIRKIDAKKSGVSPDEWIPQTKEERNWVKNKRNRSKRANGGSHTLGEWCTLKAQYNFTCPCCKKSEPEVKLTEDHIIPVSKGGSDNIENIQPLCLRCNIKKFTKVVKY